MRLLGINCVGFNAPDQLCLDFLHLSDIEKKCKYNETVNQVFINLMQANDSVRREVLYNIFIEYGVSRKVVSLIKT
jgi:hypothetical protein